MFIKKSLVYAFNIVGMTTQSCDIPSYLDPIRAMGSKKTPPAGIQIEKYIASVASLYSR